MWHWCLNGWNAVAEACLLYDNNVKMYIVHANGRNSFVKNSNVYSCIELIVFPTKINANKNKRTKEWMKWNRRKKTKQQTKWWSTILKFSCLMLRWTKENSIHSYIVYICVRPVSVRLSFWNLIYRVRKKKKNKQFYLLVSRVANLLISKHLF